jgi:hypothetical protein
MKPALVLAYVGLLLTVIGCSKGTDTSLAPPSGAAEHAQLSGETQYALSSDSIVLQLVEMRVLGLMKEGESDADIGEVQDVMITDTYVVKRVPVEFIEACTLLAMELAAAEGYGDPDSIVPGRPAFDRRKATKALTGWWAGEAMASWSPEDKGGPPTDIIKRDHMRSKTLSSGQFSPQIPLDIQWLLFPAGMQNLAPIGGVRYDRKPVTLGMLVLRFEPRVVATTENADSIAEELIWTKRLTLSEGTSASVVVAREVIQAALLEHFGFDIGDVLDSDATRRQQARARFEEARTVFYEVYSAKNE